MKLQSELIIPLKAPQIPAGLAFGRPSSCKVRYLHKAALAFVPSVKQGVK